MKLFLIFLLLLIGTSLSYGQHRLFDGTYNLPGNPATATAVINDYYLNTVHNILFKKGVTNWHMVDILQGTIWHNGSGTPTSATAGNPGDFYLNTTTGEYYKKVTSTWVLQGNLTGPSGGPAVNCWNVTGNAGTNPSANFVGTTDNAALAFRVNNQKAGLIERGDVGVVTLGGNTFFGFHSGAAYIPINKSLANTAIGANALASNTNGVQNTAIGSFSLYMNNDVLNDGGGHASWNTAVGAAALADNTEGVHNTASGYSTMHNNTTGSSNSAFGDQSLNLNTTGYWNAAFGFKSLHDNLAGNNNTAIGTYAASNTVGDNNTAVGYQCLQFNSTGSFNTALGYNANVTVNNLQNATAIGYNALVSVSNAIVLGATGADQVNVGIGTTAPTSKLQVVGLPVFTNNASAIAGGLTPGAFYRTGGDPDLVCVVHLATP